MICTKLRACRFRVSGKQTPSVTDACEVAGIQIREPVSLRIGDGLLCWRTVQAEPLLEVGPVFELAREGLLTHSGHASVDGQFEHPLEVEGAVGLVVVSVREEVGREDELSDDVREIAALGEEILRLQPHVVHSVSEGVVQWHLWRVRDGNGPLSPRVGCRRVRCVHEHHFAIQ